MSQFSEWSAGRLWALALMLVLGGSLVALAAKRREEGVFAIEKSVENFRDAPKGKKIGTLLEGVEIEKISQEGKWVRFRVEGWVWGPSLEGFEAERESEEKTEAPRLPLQDNLPRIKLFINETYGVFYGVSLDKITRRLVVRFRIRNIDREKLERSQMAVQYRVLEILEDELDFETIRIENCRPDGSGPVGTEIAETGVADIRQYAGGAVDEWKAHTRISTDGGETWNQGDVDERSAPAKTGDPEGEIQGPAHPSR